MTSKTQSPATKTPPFWDTETAIAVGVALVAIGLYALPILLWVVDTI